MNMQSFAESARLYARSEALVLDILFRVYTRKIIAIAIAILTGAVGLVFLNFTAYFALQTIWGPIWTPLAIGLANFMMAGLAILSAAFMNPKAELALAKELRDSASQAVEHEFRSPTISGGWATGLDANLINLLLPIVISIVRNLSRHKRAAKAAEKN